MVVPEQEEHTETLSRDALNWIAKEKDLNAAVVSSKDISQDQFAQDVSAEQGLYGHALRYTPSPVAVTRLLQSVPVPSFTTTTPFASRPPGPSLVPRAHSLRGVSIQFLSRKLHVTQLRPPLPLPPIATHQSQEEADGETFRRADDTPLPITPAIRIRPSKWTRFCRRIPFVVFCLDAGILVAIGRPGAWMGRPDEEAVELGGTLHAACHLSRPGVCQRSRRVSFTSGMSAGGISILCL
ncbi:hypothetical protein DFH06DRAFT_339520 [Mycena polygramma]|nr:hypothetical protein DFH06DRAFT_339520 [Mycena polygramma]